MSSRNQRRRSRRPATVAQRERERLLSYLPTEEAPRTRATEELATESGATQRATLHTQPQRSTRDYSYVPTELLRVLLLTVAIVILLIVLALILR
jgi:hypothetical protein